jgi:hypothetical protein
VLSGIGPEPPAFTGASFVTTVVQMASALLPRRYAAISAADVDATSAVAAAASTARPSPPSNSPRRSSAWSRKAEASASLGDAASGEFDCRRDATAHGQHLVHERRVGIDQQRRRHHAVEVHGPGRLAHQRDVPRITAERGDVAIDELQRLDDVQQGEVAGVV